MANPEYVIVSKNKPHNSLWAIAEHYLGDGTKYKQLAAINNISNPDYIVVGQKIYLSAPEKTLSTAAVVTGNAGAGIYTSSIGWSTTEDALIAEAFCGRPEVTKFTFEWGYMTDDGNWHYHTEGSTDTRLATVNTDRVLSTYTYAHDKYSPPSSAIMICVRAKVAAPTFEDMPWCGWVQFSTQFRPPKQLPAPQITAETNLVYVELHNIPDDVSKVQFLLYRDNSNSICKSSTVPVVTAWASARFVIDSGDFGDGESHVYKARCRGENDAGYGPYSLYTDNVTIQPTGESNITEYRAVSENAVYLAWVSLTAALTYEIQYAENPDYLDASNMSSTVTTEDATPYFTLGGLTAGTKYYFRVRGRNDTGVSVWSQIVSISVGTTPTPPTTWSSVAAVSLGEPVMFYWIHNSEDGSDQTAAELEITVNGVTLDTILTTASDYTFHTWSYNEGATIRWRVRTAGVTDVFSEYSISREITVLSPVSLTLTATDGEGNALDTLSSFPIRITGTASTNNQTPIGYHLNITSNETYKTVDRIGNLITIKKGDSVYSKYFSTSNELITELSTCDVDLESGVTYTIGCIVSMDTGATAENSVTFTVNWSDTMFAPYADISIDKNDFSATITPYCKYVEWTHYKVTEALGVYTITAEEIPYVYGEMVRGAKTTTGEQVYYGTTGDGDEAYYCYVQNVASVEGVTLAVYRREFDGSFTEIVSGIENGSDTCVVDPHPALDYARYRIVATYTSTGAISYSDTAPVHVGGDSMIIQWDEPRSNFLGSDSSYEPNPIAWTGSMIKIKANIDVSEQTNRDVSLVNYIGRKRSVSYYGTQIGETASWSAVISKDDEETLYALRRLSIWMGNAYVREPSGTGYWASVNVSFSQKHNDPAIPVSLDITRVEGGI